MSHRHNRKKKRIKRSAKIVLATFLSLLLIIVIAIRFSSDNNPCGDYGESNEPGRCNTSAENYDQLVMIVGNTQNSLAPDLDFDNDKNLQLILHDVFYNSDAGSNPKVSIVSASGDNYSIEYNTKNINVEKKVKVSAANLKNLAANIKKAIKTPATQPGADYVGAISEATNLISGSSEHPVIIIVGSGLSDSGVLDFANDGLIEKRRNNGSNIINNILAQNPNLKEESLSKVSVYWYNLGNVVFPQPSINDNKNIVKDIYGDLFSYLGVKEQSLDNYKDQTSDDKSVDSKWSVQPTFIDELKVGDVFSVNERIGKFEPDKDILLNSGEVRHKLSSFAERFKSSKNIKLELTGYIAICKPGSTLGLERAEVIKSVLTTLGIPAEKMTTKGEAGPPPDNDDELFSCNNTLADEEKRTVIIRVIEDEHV